MGKLTQEQERGLRIKELRELAGLHLNVLAQQAGLGSGGVRNGQTIKNWEAGDSTGALSQSLTDDGGVDASTPAVDMAVAAPDMALAPIPPGVRIRPRIPVSGSLAINAPMGLWDAKLNTACEPAETIDGRVRCVPKNVFPKDLHGSVYYYDANCTQPFFLARKIRFPYGTCSSRTLIGTWAVRMKPRGQNACDSQAVRPVMFAMVVTADETIPLVSSVKYYQFVEPDLGSYPLGACPEVAIPTDYDKEYVVMRMAGYEASEFAEMSELH